MSIESPKPFPEKDTLTDKGVPENFLIACDAFSMARDLWEKIIVQCDTGLRNPNIASACLRRVRALTEKLSKVPQVLVLLDNSQLKDFGEYVSSRFPNVQTEVRELPIKENDPPIENDSNQATIKEMADEFSDQGRIYWALKQRVVRAKRGKTISSTGGTHREYKYDRHALATLAEDILRRKRLKEAQRLVPSEVPVTDTKASSLVTIKEIAREFCAYGDIGKIIPILRRKVDREKRNGRLAPNGKNRGDWKYDHHELLKIAQSILEKNRVNTFFAAALERLEEQKKRGDKPEGIIKMASIFEIARECGISLEKLRHCIATAEKRELIKREGEYSDTKYEEDKLRIIASALKSASLSCALPINP